MRAWLRASLITSLIIVLSVAVIGCAGQESKPRQDGQAGTSTEPIAIKIGTLTTEDLLPLWVAEQKGYFAEEGVSSVEIVTFQSPLEVNAALTSGSIDAAMGDALNAAALFAGGTEVRMPFVTLGEDPTQGRFAVVASPGSSATSIEDLAGVPVGIGSNTILEYMFDTMMAEAGVAEDKVLKEEIKAIPVRFEMLMAGQVKAAALPASFVSLAEKQGAVVVADDTKGDKNLTQSIFMVTEEYMDAPGGAETIEAVMRVWDRAVDDVNANPDEFRQTLVEKAKLPEVLKDSYAVSTYPMAKLPTSGMVDPLLTWMKSKGYLTVDLTYDDSNGTFLK